MILNELNPTALFIKSLYYWFNDENMVAEGMMIFANQMIKHQYKMINRLCN